MADQKGSRNFHFDDFKIQPAKIGKCLLRWYKKTATTLPWRKAPNPYTTWVSEIMLQQTVIKAVLPAYDRFLTAFPTLQSLARANEHQVRLACGGLGYYRRFALLHQAAKQLTSESGQRSIRWPESYEEWMSLPGIGPYTAAAISSIILGAPYAVLDGNVERVLCRLLDIRLPPNQLGLKKHLQAYADRLLVREDPGDFNQAIMELGQRVCLPSNPKCIDCPIQLGCWSYERQSQSEAPQKKLRKKMIDLQMSLMIQRHNRLIGICKRSSSAKFLKESYGFPTAIESGTQPDSWRLAAIGEFKHTITNHKIKVRVYAKEGRGFAEEQLEWVPELEVGNYLTTSLDKKGWQIYRDFSEHS